jgi:hypothetical protein
MHGQQNIKFQKYHSVGPKLSSFFTWAAADFEMPVCGARWLCGILDHSLLSLILFNSSSVSTRYFLIISYWRLTDRPWGPPSLLYNGYRVYFPGIKRPGRGVDHPLPSRKHRAIPVLLLWAFVACYRVKCTSNLPSPTWRYPDVGSWSISSIYCHIPYTVMVCAGKKLFSTLLHKNF